MVVLYHNCTTLSKLNIYRYFCTVGDYLTHTKKGKKAVELNLKLFISLKETLFETEIKHI